MSLEDAAAAAGYMLVNLAARGDRSSIYRADRDGERVALRVFGPDADRAALRARADELSAIDHSNVVSIHEVVELDDEIAVALDWFDGVTLADALAGPDPMPEARAERLAEQLLDGLQAFHRSGRAHGSVGVRNILIDGDTLLLVDLGLGDPTAAACSPADDVRAVGPVLDALFARSDIPPWRATALAATRSDEAPADAAAVKAAVLPSRRQRVRLERAENDEKPPLLLMVAVGLGATLLTLGAFLWLGPDEEPLPGPTITGEETDTGS